MSEDGKFHLELSDSVGLIMRDSTGKTLWVLDIRPTWGVDRLDMQSNYNLVLYTEQGKAIWASNVMHVGAGGNERCVIDGDGDLVASNWGGTLWSSKSAAGLVRTPSDNFLKKQETLLPRDASGAPYVPGTRPGERTEIVPDQPLKKGERLVSLNGKYWLELSDETGFVLRDAAGQVLWNSGLQPTRVGYLAMQNDKNLVLYTVEGKPVWSADIPPSGLQDGLQCTLADDGDLVAADRGGVLWGAGSLQGPGIIPSGGVLRKGQSLRSSDAQYSLTLQETGNLVLTGPKGDTVWMAGLVDPTIDRLVMQHDGNLVLLTNANEPVWGTNTAEGHSLSGKWLRVNTDGTITVAGRDGTSWSSGRTAPGWLNPGQGLAPGSELRSARGRLRVQDDGDVVLYDSNNIIRWGTRTRGKTIRGLNLSVDSKLVLYGRDGSTLWSFDASDWRRESKSFELRGMGLFLGKKVLLPDQLYDRENIKQGDFLFSPGKEFQLTLERDGQLTIRRVSDQQLRWSNGVKTQDEVWVSIQEDRNLVEYAKGRPVWTTRTQGGTSHMALGLDDNGVLSLRRDEGTLVWQQGWPLQLLSGESLKPGEALGSKDGKYVLTFTKEGNLELTACGASSPVWSSNTGGKWGREFSVQNDGDLVIFDGAQPTKRPIWRSNMKSKQPSRYALTLNISGQLVVSEVDGKNKWLVP